MHRYILYARKSSEKEDQQAKSIEEQRQVMEEKVLRLGLQVVETICEEKSAKTPYRRPGFDRMVELLKEGKADAIVTYHVNRLSRNRIESGVIEHYLQERVITEIITAERTYYPEDNGIVLAVEGAQANQYSRDLSKVVKRGMDFKAAEGWLPHLVPEGYVNEPYTREIINDSVRFSLLKRAWEEMSTGTVTLAELADHLASWGYVGRNGRKWNKQDLSRMFARPFYTGHFVWGGRIRQGKHEAMVSMEMYDKVRSILDRSGQKRGYKQRFPYTGLIRCQCGRLYTAERIYKDNGKQYAYYRCSDYTCKNRRLTEKEVDQQVYDLVSKLKTNINPKYLEFARKEVDRWYGRESGVEESTMKNLHSQDERLQKELTGLIRMMAMELISQDDFLTRQTAIKSELSNVRLNCARAEERLEKARAQVLKVCDLARTAQEKFELGGIDERRALALDLGTGFTVENGVLTLAVKEILQPAMFELTKKGSKSLDPHISEQVVSLGRAARTTFETLYQVWGLALQGKTL